LIGFFSLFVSIRFHFQAIKVASNWHLLFSDLKVIDHGLNASHFASRHDLTFGRHSNQLHRRSGRLPGCLASNFRGNIQFREGLFLIMSTLVSWLIIVIMAGISRRRKSRRIQRGIAEYLHRKREGKQSLGQATAYSKNSAHGKKGASPVDCYA
jgi:hypothetical protein